MEKFSNNLIPWIGKTAKMMGMLMNERFLQKGVNLTHIQCLLLGRLHQQDGQLQKELAFLTGRDKTSLGRLLGTMERKGFITRISASDDKRAKQVFITKSGREAYLNGFPLVKSTIEEAQHGIPQEKLDMAIEVLQHIQKNINQMDEGEESKPSSCYS